MLKRIKKIIEDDYEVDLKDVVYVSFYIYVLMGHFVNHTQIFQICSLLFMAIELVYMIKIRKLYISHYLVFFALFICYCIALNKTGISVSASNSSGMISTLWVDVILNFFVVNYLFVNDNLQTFPKIYSQTGFIYCLYMLITNISSLGSGRLGWNQPIPFGLEGRTYQSNSVGFILAYAFNMYMYRILALKERKCIPAAVLCAVGAFLTGSRKALLIVIIGMFFMIYCFYEGKSKIKIIIIGAVAVVVMYIMVMNIPVFYNTVGYRFQEFIDGKKTGEMEDGSALVRQHLIDYASMYHKEKPWFGYGIDNFKTLEGTYGLYAHNNFLEILCDTGRVGFFLFYISYLIGMIYLIVGYVKKKKLAILGVVCLAVFVVMEYGMITYYERPNQLILIFCIITGTQVVKEIKSEKEQKLELNNTF